MKRAFVCASSCIKEYVQSSYGCRGTPVVARMCVYTAQKIFNTKNVITKSRDAAAKKNRYKRSRDK